MDDVKAEAETCRVKDGLVHTTINKATSGERYLSVMVSKFVLNSVTKADMDEIDLH